MTKQIKSVSIIGDSLFKGIVFDKNKKVYNVTKDNCINYLEKEVSFKINNYSLCGLNISNLNKYLDLVLNKSNNEIIILEIGFDSFVENFEELEIKPIISINKVKRNIIKAIKTCKEVSKQVMITLIPFVSEQRHFDFLKDQYGFNNQVSILEINDYIFELNNIIKEVCEKYNILMIDCNSDFNGNNEELYSNDGRNLSVKGHEKLKNIFINNLKNASIKLI